MAHRPKFGEESTQPLLHVLRCSTVRHPLKLEGMIAENVGPSVAVFRISMVPIDGLSSNTRDLGIVVQALTFSPVRQLIFPFQI
eukprot:CAMPEP_0172766940 /NCGR_PEP_ID=MMETSP1074-20121228/182126_1 /TAXON_ID=2916 /ORGANISM="Ceratium fusus, Strain PA161109" /LENGTH=83 /DNA_ID=CAMNT_0013602127 /DNA_START=11 /DNA_END=259 /DNA_ORIENTATION=-